MKKILLASVLWLPISFGLMGNFACKSSTKNTNPSDSVTEMPAPLTVDNIDSLKRIQQQKRDSLQLKK